MIRALRAGSLMAATIALALATTTASASWTIGSVAGGGGAVAADTLDQLEAPTATATGSSVTVGWAASSLANGSSVDGYELKRYDATTLVEQAMLGSCSAAATSCTEVSLPTGDWVYSVTALTGTYWRGPASAKSNSVHTDATAPPANAITANTTAGNAVLISDTLYYRGQAAGSFTLTNAVSSSDPASSATAALTGSSAGWNHTASTVSSPAAGPYVSNPFGWGAATTSTPTEIVTGRDGAGRGTQTSLAFVNDSTAPTAGTITYADGYQTGQFVNVSFTSGTDSGSGIATRRLQRSSAAMTAGDCGTFTGYANVGPDGPTSAYVDDQVSEASCYRYRLVVTDRVANQQIATSPNTAKVDSGAGGPALGASRYFSVLAGTGVVSTGSTVVSGDLGVSPGSSISGFPPGVVTGDTHSGDAAAAQARSDLTLAYNDAATRTPSNNFAGDLNGQTFRAGVHHTAAAFALTGTLTLDGENDPNAVFIFQIDAAMNTAAASTVNLINGAQPAHVFWQVNGAAGTGATSTLAGTVMATGAITLGAGTNLTGRALSYGTVTLSGNTVRFTAAAAPVVAIDGGASVVTKDTTPAISGTSDVAAGTPVSVTFAGQVLGTTIQGDHTWSVTAASVAAGAYPVRASVRDSAGNSGAATQTMTVEVNPAPVPLGTAGAFSVLAGTGVVSTGSTVVDSDLGVSPSNSITGFPPGIVRGTTHPGDVVAAQAQTDLTLAYNDAAARTPHTNFTGDLNGRTFHAGVHHTAAALALTGTLTLDGENDPNAVFIFQVDAAMNTAASSTVNLINGARADHVFWQVDGAVGTGATSTLAGTIMATGAVTLGAGTNLTGRALSYGTITLAGNTVAP